MTGHCNLNCPSETFSMTTRDDLSRFDSGFNALTNRTSLLAIKRVARIAHLDVGREIRKGLPEIILAEGKAPQDVAGLHRLFKPLSELLKWDSDVILVVAGREGALPTVVAGLVNVPVIGVPTSRSYGFGDKGIAALAAMLQSCSLGIAVVNIDGGVGAGSVGALIANRVARYRAGRS